MDVLVKWTDGTENIVLSSQIRVVDKSKPLKKGAEVKMYWKPEKKWYFGRVIAVENNCFSSSDSESNIFVNMQSEDSNSGSSDDDIPLQLIKQKLATTVTCQTNICAVMDKTDGNNEPDIIQTKQTNMSGIQTTQMDQLKTGTSAKLDVNGDEKVLSSHSEPSEFEDNSDEDPTYVQTCELQFCKEEVFSACPHCLKLLCWNHFSNDDSCGCRGVVPNRSTADKVVDVPGNYTVEGNPSEREPDLVMKKKENRKKTATKMRNLGETYISYKSKKIMPARKILGPRCNGISCSKIGKKCALLTEEERTNILNDFYGTSSIQLQREFIARFVKRINTKQKTKNEQVSRRHKSNYYFLPKQDSEISVCKKMFLSTLGISEKVMRTSLAKVRQTGVVEKDQRGGRPINLKNKDEAVKNLILEHIKQFPRMESHYCRQSSTREYLHADLTVKKMYDMFISEQGGEKNNQISYSLYLNVFKSLRLSFHHPKKDQCGLCFTYRQGTMEKKTELEERYRQHIAEKERVREIKNQEKADSDSSKICAVFDLQQVIFLPIGNESKLFYRRRLANYNFTIYEVKSKKCHCFLWNEALSKRGSCEISTCLYLYLKELDTEGITNVSLFSDGCSGQNKNSIVGAMLLHAVTNLKNLQCISLRFFEPYHGQSEGDAAHSTIDYAIKKSGDLFVPSQLAPVIKLARRKNPYIVHSLTSTDFLDFKTLSNNLKILAVRKDDEGGTVDWKQIREIMVQKSSNNKIFFKNSHLQNMYQCITLKRTAVNVRAQPPSLNPDLPKISTKKYNDLIDLCSGTTPVIKLPEHVSFYRQLPH